MPLCRRSKYSNLTIWRGQALHVFGITRGNDSGFEGQRSRNNKCINGVQRRLLAAI
jgi:hypothetical protein